MAPSQDKLIDSLVPDPSRLPDLKIRAGFLGDSTDEKSWRLYRNPVLTDYIEFAKDDVLHTVSVESDLSPLGGTVVFLERTAEIRRTRTTRRESQSEWVTGSFAREVMRKIPGFTTVPGGPAALNPTWVLVSIVIIIQVLSQITDDCDGGDGGGSDFTLTNDTLCTGSPGSC